MKGVKKLPLQFLVLSIDTITKHKQQENRFKENIIMNTRIVTKRVSVKMSKVLVIYVNL